MGWSEQELAELMAKRGTSTNRKWRQEPSVRLAIYAGRNQLRAGAVEREVQAAILAYFDVHGIPYSVTDAAEVFNHKGQRIRRVTTGTSDVTACLPPNGRYFGVECKRAVGGTLRNDQAAFLHRIHAAGGLVVIARSVEDVIEAMMKGTRQEDLDEITHRLAHPLKKIGLKKQSQSSRGDCR